MEAADLSEVMYSMNTGLLQFTVVTAANLPPKPVLAVHAGNIRRQIKLEATRACWLPRSGSRVDYCPVLLYRSSDVLLRQSEMLRTTWTQQEVCAARHETQSSALHPFAFLQVWSFQCSYESGFRFALSCASGLRFFCG